MNSQDKLVLAKQKLKESYALYDKKKNSRKLIVLLNQHIEKDILFRKKRVSS